MELTVHINRLPLELLTSMFITLVRASHSAPHIRNMTYGTTDYSILLASVCTCWRRIALGTPSLWTYVDLTRNRNLPKSCNYAELYFRRSVPLQLYVHLGRFSTQYNRHLASKGVPCWDTTLGLPEEIQSLLVAHAPRIRSFALDTCEHMTAVAALRALVHDVANHTLEDLAMRTGWKSELLADKRIEQLFTKLNALYLESHFPGRDSIPCHNLVELYLVGISWASSMEPLVRLLTANPGLRILHVMQSYYDTPETLYTRTVHLPNLRNLELNQLNGKMLTWFLNVIAPGPHDLDLRLRCTDVRITEDVALREAMIAFFQKSSIISLNIAVKCISLALLLSFLPRLRRLGLCLFRIYEDTFDGIDEITNVLVHLHTIDLEECVFYDDELYPGLRTLLTLPSVRQIWHISDGVYDHSQARFLKLFPGWGINTPLAECRELCRHMYSSPFRKDLQ
ncbi:hypothetical protein FRC08_004167 [Ceratobasidium sp. 394]|nr:hypothetical protein FRC08_004167 [Ceratobasidium sp. 394]KAG9099286.1 hypothetical protein FS749_001603 [Ceratobasidium sp. UAMH 11750]